MKGDFVDDSLENWNQERLLQHNRISKKNCRACEPINMSDGHVGWSLLLHELEVSSTDSMLRTSISSQLFFKWNKKINFWNLFLIIENYQWASSDRFKAILWNVFTSWKHWNIKITYQKYIKFQ